MSRQRTPRMDFAPGDKIDVLAETIWADYRDRFLARANTSCEAGALCGIGYKDWIVGGQSYTSPSTPRRRSKVLDGLLDRPYFADLAVAFDQLGFDPPQRDCGERTGPMEIEFRIEGSVIEYGVNVERGRDLVLARYDRMYLRVLDGPREVATHIGRLDATNVVSLAALKLTDDDYRFHVGAEGRMAFYGGGLAPPGGGFPRAATSRDWAIVNGRWRELEHQGPDWDGERTESTPEHPAVSVTDHEIRAAAATIPEDEESDAVDPRAECIAYIESIRDSPPNRAVRGNPHHIRKWNRTLATLGVPTGELPWTAAEIYARAEKWPGSPWARAANILSTT